VVGSPALFTVVTDESDCHLTRCLLPWGAHCAALDSSNDEDSATVKLAKGFSGMGAASSTSLLFMMVSEFDSKELFSPSGPVQYTGTYDVCTENK
jgi:hypothetical protein